MKLRSGIGGEAVAEPAVLELCACLTAVNGRQIIAKALLYVFHNGLESAKEVIDSFRMSLIYAFVSPNGISHHLKKYLSIVAEQGYLTEENCQDSVFAKRALELYPRVHELYQKKGKAGLSEFVTAYVGEAWVDTKVTAEELLISGDLDEAEAEELENAESSLEEDEDVDEDDEEQEDVNDVDEEEDVGPCDCEFCEEMRTMVNLDLDSIKMSSAYEQQQWDSLKETVKRLLLFR